MGSTQGIQLWHRAGSPVDRLSLTFVMSGGKSSALDSGGCVNASLGRFQSSPSLQYRLWVVVAPV